MTEHFAATVDEVAEGKPVVVEIRGREIGVFERRGEYYAYPNWCAHQGGPLCNGKITGTTDASFDRDTLETTLEWVKEDEIIMCPWHGWEFDIVTGECYSDPGVSLLSYPVTVRDDEIYLTL